jgi:hypothetical protein
MNIHPDFNEFVAVLNKNKVEYVIVGSFALAFHGYPRATGDIDFWIRPTPVNVTALFRALGEFGFKELEISEDDLMSGKIIQLGYPPVRIDLITVLDGLEEEDIWRTRAKGKFGNHAVFYLGREAFVKNKRALGRYKDLADLELLGEKV